MKEDNIKIDQIKSELDELPYFNNPLLQRYKIEFQLFYEKDVIVREFTKEESKLIPEVIKNCSDVGIDFKQHIQKRVFFIDYYKILFLQETIKPSQLKALIDEIYIKLKMEQISIQTPLGAKYYSKPLNKLTDTEKTALDFDFGRPFRLKYINQQIETLKPILYTYSHIKPDQDFIEGKSKQTSDSSNNPTLIVEAQNNFNSMPFYRVKQHFMQLVNSKNNRNCSFLSEQDLELFLKVCISEGKTLDEKIKLNFGSGQKGLMQNVFYQFYSDSKTEFDNPKSIDKYIKLLTSNFEQFNFKTVKSNFSKYFDMKLKTC